MLTGIASSHAFHRALGELSRRRSRCSPAAAMASPAGLMFLGLGLIGLRDRIGARVPRRCLSSSQGLVVWLLPRRVLRRPLRFAARTERSGAMADLLIWLIAAVGAVGGVVLGRAWGARGRGTRGQKGGGTRCDGRQEQAYRRGGMRFADGAGGWRSR